MFTTREAMMTVSRLPTATMKLLLPGMLSRAMAQRADKSARLIGWILVVITTGWSSM